MSESALVKMPNCLKSHVAAHLKSLYIQFFQNKAPRAVHNHEPTTNTAAAAAAAAAASAQNAQKRRSLDISNET